jgi:putative tricarboxylic transport membrane protein
MLKKLVALGLAACALALVGASQPAQAQEFDHLDIMIIAGPGSGQDQFVRAVSDTLREEGLASGIEISSVVGAGGTAALLRFLQNGAQDGEAIYTLGASTQLFTLINDTQVKPTDAMPLVRLVGDYPVVVVKADSDIKDMNDLIARLKADPGALPYGGSDAGMIDHVFYARLALLAGIDLSKINYVPFPNTGEISMNILSGQLGVASGTPGDFVGQVQAGKMRYLAIAAPERIPGVDAPTFKELGIDLVMPVSRGFLAHPDTTPEQKAKLEEIFAKMVKSDRWKQHLKDRSWLDQYQNAADYEAYLKSETQINTDILTKLGFIKG